MAEPRFIKTVTFGGYDKESVIRRIEFLNNQIYDMRNELRETKLILESYKKGADIEKAQESVLAEERARLTQVQVQNDTLSLKLKATDDENRNLEQEIKDCRAELSELKEKLRISESKCEALIAKDEALALSNVFIEAQKSSAMLETAAKTKAADIETKSRKLAESIVDEANTEAEQIIYEAEAEAAVKIADAKNRAAQMEVTSGNLRSAAVEDIEVLKEQVVFMEEAFETLRNEGIDRLIKAKELLEGTEDKLKNGGIPVFRVPEYFEAEIPEKPASLADKMRENSKNEEEKRKKLEELAKLRQMADSISGKKDDENKEEDEKADAPAEPQNKPAASDKKGQKINLAALAAKANAIDK